MASTSCDLLPETNESMRGGFTIRGIDQLIHNSMDDNSSFAYQIKQLGIISEIRGHEIVLFNDPTVQYLSHRPHFAGKTGTMSNILTGTFYYLYEYLITNPDIEVNVRADLQTLFYAILLMNGQEIPWNDEEVLRNIIYQLLQQAETQGERIFSPEWWDAVPSRISHIIAQTSKGNQQMWRIFQSLLDGASVFDFGPYENTVEYVSHNLNLFETQITQSEDIQPILEFVRGFFIKK
jgi:hypothetical protein